MAYTLEELNRRRKRQWMLMAAASLTVTSYEGQSLELGGDFGGGGGGAGNLELGGDLGGQPAGSLDLGGESF